MYGIEVTLPNGREPSWDDVEELNIGVGVVPEIQVQILLGERDDSYEPIVHMHLSFHYYDARYKARFVGLQAPNVSSVDLREVRVGEYLSRGALGGVFVRSPDDDGPPASLLANGGGEPTYAHNPEVRAGRPTTEVLKWVALTYQVAQICAQPPAKAVERAFALPSRTAARWIARAKDAGLLVRPAVPGWEISDEHAELRERVEKQVAEGTAVIEVTDAKRRSTS